MTGKEAAPVLEIIEDLNQESLDMLYSRGKLTGDNHEAILTHEQMMKGDDALWSDSEEDDIDG
jgi:hypothetical protein